ncbi:MAG TPA: methylamine utilization protein [Noviherbaspirillum sp.]|uniref:methylamine utilization protein n=1 Tax=Noviherbaspirillum sp. TaxID=1926288 RepID=UPI002DDDB719|nr:methylamine utilization protein [Noviherbaspirillum sp.]HEV2610583.1 methylamine utilization protein [Noviherbaspirillum sp.]
MLLASTSSHAGNVAATMTDKAGAPLSNVVLFATPVGVAVPPPQRPLEPATIVQEELQFKPYVSVVRAGTAIGFPNNDKIEHHVKSFSPAKEFEYKVYDKGTPPPVVFDKPGLVVVYCLLHGWMRSYIMVVDTPHHSLADAAGSARLDGLPDGTYEVKAWHPDLGSIKPPLTQTVKITGGGTQPLAFNFDFVPRKPRTAK